MATKAKPSTATVDRETQNIQTWLYALEDQTERLTPWERDFLENVTDWFERGGKLSEKQYNRLEEMYRKVY